MSSSITRINHSITTFRQIKYTNTKADSSNNLSKEEKKQYTYKVIFQK
jgi:hypothetical protein